MFFAAARASCRAGGSLLRSGSTTARWLSDSTAVRWVAVPLLSRMFAAAAARASSRAGGSLFRSGSTAARWVAVAARDGGAAVAGSHPLRLSLALDAGTDLRRGQWGHVPPLKKKTHPSLPFTSPLALAADRATVLLRARSIHRSDLQFYMRQSARFSFSSGPPSAPPWHPRSFPGGWRSSCAARARRDSIMVQRQRWQIGSADQPATVLHYYLNPEFLIGGSLQYTEREIEKCRVDFDKIFNSLIANKLDGPSFMMLATDLPSNTFEREAEKRRADLDKIFNSLAHEIVTLRVALNSAMIAIHDATRYDLTKFIIIIINVYMLVLAVIISHLM